MRVKNLIDKLEKIRKSRGLSQRKFASEELEIDVGAYNRYIKGTMTPRGDRIEKFMDYIDENGPSDRKTIKNTNSEIITDNSGQYWLFDDDGNCAKIASIPDMRVSLDKMLEEEDELTVPE